MKIFICMLSALSVMGSAYSQITPFKPDEKQFAKAAEILPPAPDASAIARYGGVDIDLGTGSVNKSIQLKTFTDRAISIPVGLSYASNGIKVNDYPSRTGMGWAMHIGGQISRVIHGKDDLVATRYMPGFNITPNDENAATTNYCWHLMDEGTRDASPDEFTYDFGGYSGKFVFDHSGNILCLPATNFKIAYNTNTGTDNTWNFSITTPDGIKYFFGGPDAREETKFTAGAFNYDTYSTNVWYLNKILHPAGYYTTLTYQSKTISSYIVGIAQSQFKLSPDAGATVCNSDPLPTCVDGILPNYDGQTYMSAHVMQLTQITSSYGSKVTIGYSTSSYPDNLITQISYFNENNTRVIKYLLHYTIASAGTSSLPFLDNIKELDDQDAELNSGHQFEYLNMNSLPVRVTSYAQDHWGYYNGKTNTTLIATPEDDETAFNFPLATANRNADANYTGNGLLSKITYPTGGKDEITYEPNIVEELQDQNTYAHAVQTKTATASSWQQSAGASFSVTYETRLKLVMHCAYIGNSDYDHVHDGGKVRIVNNSTSAEVYLRDNLKPYPDDQVEFINLSSGSYTIYVSSYGVDIKTDADLKYRTGSSPNMQYVAVAEGGMRVKKVVTSDNFVNNPIIKRYYYGTLTNLNFSSAAYVPKPNYYVAFDYIAGFVDQVCTPTTHTYHHQALNYMSINKLYQYDGKLIKYASVIESEGGDNFENGATEHKFDNASDDLPIIIRGVVNFEAPLTNSSYLSKGETETNIYAKKSGNLVPVKSTLYTTTIDNTRNFNVLTCYSVKKNGELPCTVWDVNNNLVGPYPFNHIVYSVDKYYITSAWKYLSSKTEKQYDENGQNPLTVVMNYYYDDDRNLMLSRTEATNSKGELLKNQTKYPHDFAATGNVYERMVSKNMISEPVEEKSFKGSQLLITKKTNFDDSWFGDHHITEVGTIDIQKNGFSNETRFRYSGFDTYGNPMEMSKENDIKQSYLWGYNSNYPVAKVLNAPVADIAYTSFETADQGGFTYSGTPGTNTASPTGKKIYPLNGNSITRSVNSGKAYVISLWADASAVLVNGNSPSKTGRTINGWTYYEWLVTGSSTVTVSAGTAINIDELRLYPKDAQMVTSTYDPMFGLTSQADINNNITYYEYDAVGRLKLIRDENRNIIKAFEYKYQQ